MTEVLEKEDLEYLDRMVDRIKMRLHHEKLMDLVPSIRAQNEQNRVIVAWLHRLAAIFQKHELTLFVDEATGKTTNGHDPDQAAEEVNIAITSIRELAVRFQ